MKNLANKLSRKTLLKCLMCCAALLFSSLSLAATPAHCINNADDVVLRGTATKEPLKMSDGRVISVWILTTETAVCIYEFNDTDTLKKSPVNVSRIQILGAAPPTGVLIELHGMLRTGNFTPYYAVPNSISVSSGIRVRKKSADEATTPSSSKRSDDGDNRIALEAIALPLELKRAEEPKLKKNTDNASNAFTPDRTVRQSPIPTQIMTALTTAKQKAMLFNVDLMEVESDDTPGASGYSIYIRYKKESFTGNWLGREAVVSYDDQYNLATEIVKQLVKIDQDPGMKAHSRYVSVCSELDGATSAAGKPVVEFLGCANYSPDKDVVDRDFTKVSTKFASAR
ncbi:hypothetical protein [Sapientia aquatica]|uniref:Uncharacterized protein n=1 Tax=Sapientia aquatica TaxID=1549640 RepID=A0A4R5W4N8_9BURK|nr:hypothetical protein [Sapientia aquatica]TDK67562.1 hypothetical protein E2I14_07390 [Sapientia aquatica]